MLLLEVLHVSIPIHFGDRSKLMRRRVSSAKMRRNQAPLNLLHWSGTRLIDFVEMENPDDRYFLLMACQ